MGIEQIFSQQEKESLMIEYQHCEAVTIAQWEVW